MLREPSMSKMAKKQQGPEELPPRYEPTIKEREEHLLSGHAVYRNWCDACVRARGREYAHQAAHDPRELPIVSWDYSFLGHQKVGKEATADDIQEEQKGSSPGLVMKDSKASTIGSATHPRKGIDFDGVEDVVAFWTRALDRLGYNRAVCRSDNEPSLTAFLDRLRRSWLHTRGIQPPSLQAR